MQRETWLFWDCPLCVPCGLYLTQTFLLTWLLTCSGQHQVWVYPPEEGAEGDGDRGCFGCVCVIFILFFLILQKRSIWCWSVRILNVLGRWLWWCSDIYRSDIYINIHTSTCCNAIWCQSSTGYIGASAGLRLALNFQRGKFTSHAPPFCLTSKPKGWPSGAEGCFVKFIIFLPPPSSRSFHVCKGQALQLGPSVTCQNTFLSKTEERID